MFHTSAARPNILVCDVLDTALIAKGLVCSKVETVLICQVLVLGSKSDCVCSIFVLCSKTDRLTKGAECYQKSLTENPFLWSPFESLCQIGESVSFLLECM